MTEQQQRQIIAAVLSGASWPTAALAAGATPEQLHDFIESARQGRCKLKFRFITKLKAAGKEATEASLNCHKRGA